MKKYTNKKIKRLKTYNDLEFYLGEFEKFYKNKVIDRHQTVRNTT